MAYYGILRTCCEVLQAPSTVFFKVSPTPAPAYTRGQFHVQFERFAPHFLWVLYTLHKNKAQSYHASRLFFFRWTTDWERSCQCTETVAYPDPAGADGPPEG